MLVVVVLAGAVLAAWYQIDGQPLKETETFLVGDTFKVTEDQYGNFLFKPLVPNGRGIVIMHGALIKPQSYANTGAYFAARGYTVYVPSGRGRLSINAVDAAAERMREFNLGGWFLIGHSMGGYSSLTLLARHAPDVKGVALWASGIPADFRSVQVPILYIWGDNDGLVPRDRFEALKTNLPMSVEYITLEGANHQNFAMYSHQFFDETGKLGWQEQIDFANDVTGKFFADNF